MRTSLLILHLILFCFVGFGQNINYSLLETKKNNSGNWILFKKGETKPFTGTAERKYPNGNLSNVDNFKNGKLDGTSIQYYSSNENISTKTNYKNGIYDGEMIGYYSNGEIRSLAKYKEGIAVDTSTYWHENGKKNIEYIFYKENSEKSFRWDTIGNLLYESFYYADSSFVKINSWYKNSKKKSEAFLNNGQMDSTFTVWYENGIIKEIIHYKKGEWNGTWTDFDINGNIISQGEYKNDELIKGDQMYMTVEI